MAKDMVEPADILKELSQGYILDIRSIYLFLEWLMATSITNADAMRMVSLRIFQTIAETEVGLQ